jgi:hypothetical protein
MLFEPNGLDSDSSKSEKKFEASKGRLLLLRIRLIS